MPLLFYDGGEMEDRDKVKFFAFIESQIKSIQRQILDLTEVSIPPDNWRVMRSKILGITNDLRRDLEQELITNYDLKYSPSTIYEDVVQVMNPRDKNLVYKDRSGNYGNGKK